MSRVPTIALCAALFCSCLAAAQSPAERRIDLSLELASEWRGVRTLPRSLGRALARSKLDGVSTGARITYSPEGNVLEASLVDSSGDETLDEELVKWVRSMKFKPSPTGSSGIVPVELQQAR